MSTSCIDPIHLSLVSNIFNTTLFVKANGIANIFKREIVNYYFYDTTSKSLNSNKFKDLWNIIT